MTKRIIASVFCIILLVVICTTGQKVSADGNPYPMYNWYENSESYQIACTWYAWEQVYNQQGIALPAWGNAGNWYGNAPSKGSTAKVGSIACWSISNSPPYGHVAYVTGVNSNGSINIIEGGSNWPQADEHGLCSRTVQPGQYWPDQGFIYPQGSTSVSVTFSSWENSNYTYISETDASIGQEINVSGGTCTDVGMVLYNSSGTELGRAANGNYYYRVYFKINEELGVKLKPKTTYKYKFYAIVNGTTYWSQMYSFTTKYRDYTVTFDPQSGSVSPTSKTVTYGLTYGTLPDPKRAKYTFAGWYTKASGGTKITASSTVTTAANHTLYAHWNTISVTGVSVSPTSLLMKIDDTATLTATVSPSNATNAAVTWSSSNTSVATVDSSGKVTAVANGTCTITATAKDGSGKKGTCSVKVAPANYLDLNGFIDGANATNIRNFGTADIYINGKLVANDVGDYYTKWPNGTTYEIKDIKAATGCTYNGVTVGSLSGTINGSLVVVRLSFSTVSSLTLNKSSVKLIAHKSTTLTATIKPSNSPTTTVTWSSSNPNVATVTSSGKVTGVGIGTATITAKAGDKTAKCVVTVESIFSDVKPSAYYYDAVLWAVEHNPQITSGSGDGKFSPNATCTREQIVTFLWNANGKPEPSSTTNPFSDVQSGKYYYKAVLWAVEKGITGGVEKNRFGVGDPCTRAQAMTFLWISRGRPEPTTTTNPFSDVPENSYYYKAVLWAVKKGITGGIGNGQFGPNEICTRAQIVTFLYKAFG